MKQLTVRGTCALVALALTAFAVPALAADDTATTVRPPLLAAPPAPAALASALQTAIDPATGLLRPPTVSERLELATLAREAAGRSLRRVAAASQTMHADGTVSAALDPELHALSTVFVTADGQVHYSCGEAHDHPVTVTAPAAEVR